MRRGGLLAYIGGSLPPGDGDIGGVVLAAAPVAPAAKTVSTAANPLGTIPVVGAEVLLHQRDDVVGRAVTGEDGYFSFQKQRAGSFGWRSALRKARGCG